MVDNSLEDHILQHHTSIRCVYDVLIVNVSILVSNINKYIINKLLKNSLQVNTSLIKDVTSPIFF